MSRYWAEVAHLVRRVRHGLDRFVDLLMSDLLRVDFGVMVERAAVGRLLRKYADRPMSLADAAVRGPKHVVKRGKTPVLTREEHAVSTPMPGRAVCLWRLAETVEAATVFERML